MTNYVFLWETKDGERRWEAVEKDQTKGFLEKLLNSGIPPASIIVAYNPILFHWVFEEYHKGLSDVHFGNVNDEIMGFEPEAESCHEPVIVERTVEKKYGWIAPDGRFFECGYGEHSHLAGKIVGDLEYVADPERHLEDLGWAKVMSGSHGGMEYSIGMGLGKKLTDAQIGTIQKSGLEGSDGISNYL